MFDGRFRGQIENGLRPVGRSVRKAGITPDMLTGFGVLISLGAATAIGAGALNLGLLLLVLTAVPDLLDGAVAKASGLSSKRGAFFDSVSDRFTDAAMFAGVTWYLAVQHPGPLAVLPMVTFASASLVSYVRAKAESLGYDARGGIVERAERIIILALGLLFERYLVVALAVMLVLNLITVGQRFVNVWRQASRDRPVPVRPNRQRRTPRRVTTGTTAERWRARSELRERRRQAG